jgi:hypothetical protein
MTLRVLRWAVIAICVVGVAGMIIGSIADNNNGVVGTSGPRGTSSAFGAQQRTLTWG